MKVAITYNLKTGGGSAEEEAEWDDAETIHAVEKALALEHEVVLIEANREAPKKLKQAAPDLVFNMAEGRGGPSRESQIPALLELMQIPYTGSDPLTLALCLDKSWAKDVLAAEGVSVPRNDMKFPAVVKPRWEGSSIGVRNSSLVRNRAELRREVRRIERAYHQPALIEEFLPGREFTAALLGNGDTVEVLPLVEVKLDQLPRGANPLYSFEAKWEWDRPEKPLHLFECPAQIPKSLEKKIRQIARKAFQVLACRDWARIDLRLDAEGEPRVLEVNPLPGILPRPEQNSCFPDAARAAGLSYEELILRVVELAAERCGFKVLAR